MATEEPIVAMEPAAPEVAAADAALAKEKPEVPVAKDKSKKLRSQLPNVFSYTLLEEEQPHQNLMDDRKVNQKQFLSTKKRTTSVMDSEPYSSDEGEGSANSSMEMIEVSEDGGGNFSLIADGFILVLVV
ncbi:hypothetical protein L2E82_24353 [Cichorium intybus]|uniref:Uncharacterized protein n=1 Tax=Cichorium intybus TaxID=13427 RepID=A0ACB9E116_CICIN|nr:hypothetical protein L2E82_24353 [Cichorium intybus]